jgi:putative oxidoreductase
MDTALFVLHALVGLLFVGHGLQKLAGVFGGHGLEGTGAFFESLGLRPGRLHATAAGLAETVGGALLAVGLLIPLAAALLVAVMTTAVVLIHGKKGPWNQNGGFEYNLVLVAALLLLATAGGGDASIDNAIDLGATGLGWGVAAVAAGLVGGLAAVVSGRLASRDASDEPHMPSTA